jgi:hypothetical protein
VAEITEKLKESGFDTSVLFKKGIKVQRLYGLEIMTGAEPGICDLIRVAVGSDEDLSHKFAWYFFDGKHTCPWKNVKDLFDEDGRIKPDLDPNGLFVLMHIHLSYNQTCEKLRYEIEKVSRHKLEEFCYTYTKSFFDFVYHLGRLIYESENWSLEQHCRDMAHTKALKAGPEIKAAARGVLDGHDIYRSVCWECGNHNGKVLKCSLCQAARYCCKECQRKSWIDGHKGQCGALKIMYRSFMNNYRQVKENHERIDQKNLSVLMDEVSHRPEQSSTYFCQSCSVMNYSPCS